MVSTGDMGYSIISTNMIEQFQGTTFLGGPIVQPKISRKVDLSRERQRALGHLQRQHLGPAHLQHFHLVAQQQLREPGYLFGPTAIGRVLVCKGPTPALANHSPDNIY